MVAELDDKLVKALPAPARGQAITYDTKVKGFGVRVTPGAKAFILNYRAKGRERRITIGSYPDWKVKAARDHAEALKRIIDMGGDPMAERQAEREAPTMAALADRFEKEHLIKRRDTTQESYQAILKLYVRPKLGKIKVAELRHSDVERMHAAIAQSKPYQANRAVAVVSKMLGLAVKWEMRRDNPAKGIERAPEAKRKRYLSHAEIAALAEALNTLKEKDTANAIRLLLLTGARKNEVLQARWSEFDLQEGVWTKPSAHTKTKEDHTVPLSAPALALLTAMHTAAVKAAEAGSPMEFIFPGDKPDQPLGDIKKSWATACRVAGLGKMVPVLDGKGKPRMDDLGAPIMVFEPNARIHDLRHTYASILVSRGLSLPIIGSLLGHTQTQTTLRYSHLMIDTQRAATEAVGAVFTGTKAEVVDSPQQTAAK